MWKEFLKISGDIEQPAPTHSVPSFAMCNKPVQQLSQHIETEFCKRLNRLPWVVADEKEIKISHIAYAFDNKELLEILMARGKIIMAGRFEKLEKINKKIAELMDKKSEDLARPVNAFISFET